jgi:hypothetical protein
MFAAGYARGYAVPVGGPDGRVTAGGVGARPGGGHSFENVFADQVLRWERDRIFTIETCPAQSCLRLFGRADQSIQGDITQRVRPDRGPSDLIRKSR